MAASRDLGEFIRELRSNARISLRQLAEQAGVSNPYLSQIERGLRKPSAEVLQQIANALRVSTPLMYLRAGLLAEREGQGVLAAIAADPDLSDRHKKTLIEIYEAFRRENARTRETSGESTDTSGATSGATPGSEAGSRSGDAPDSTAAAVPEDTADSTVAGAPEGTSDSTTDPDPVAIGAAPTADAPGEAPPSPARKAPKKTVRKAVKKAVRKVARNAVGKPQIPESHDQKEMS